LIPDWTYFCCPGATLILYSFPPHYGKFFIL